MKEEDNEDAIKEAREELEKDKTLANFTCTNKETLKGDAKDKFKKMKKQEKKLIAQLENCLAILEKSLPNAFSGSAYE